MTAYTGPVIDAHHHVWDLSLRGQPWLVDEPMIPFRYGDYSAIRRDYLPADFLADTATSPGLSVVGSVFVETEWRRDDALGELAWIHEVAERTGVPSVVTGHAVLDAPDVAEHLESIAAFPLARGIRHKPGGAAAPDRAERETTLLMDARWREGFARLAPLGLHFELQVPWWHLREAADLAGTFEATRIVVNHTALPADRSPEGLAGWRRALGIVAEHPNVFLKISGIDVPGVPWTADLQREVVLDALDIFGTARCMVASNFPVDSLWATYAEIFAGFREITADLSADEQRAFFFDNARAFYRIDQDRLWDRQWD